MSRMKLIVFILFLGIAGCEPEEGPMGLEGPQGIQGIQGDQGPGGEPGTANVIYSGWTPFESSAWSAPFNFFSQNRRSYTIAEDLLTDEIIDTGTVMVFVRFGGTLSSIQPLPVMQAITHAKNQVLDYHFQLGSIVIVYYNLNDAEDPGIINNSNQYRYVIIPGGTAAALKQGKIDSANLSYEGFCEMFNIPE